MTFFPVGGHKSIINGMASPRRSKMKATGAARGTAFATTQSQCSGKLISTSQYWTWGPRGRPKGSSGRCWGKAKGEKEQKIQYLWGLGCFVLIKTKGTFKTWESQNEDHSETLLVIYSCKVSGLSLILWLVWVVVLLLKLPAKGGMQ